MKRIIFKTITVIAIIVAAISVMMLDESETFIPAFVGIAASLWLLFAAGRSEHERV